MSRKIILSILALVFFVLVGGCIRQVMQEQQPGAVGRQENAGTAGTQSGTAGTQSSTAGTGSSASGTQTCTKELFAMDTYMKFTANGENCEAAVDAAMAEVKRLDALLSTGSADSEVSVINAAGQGTLSEDTAAILKKSMEIYETTGGLFDITIYPLMCLWGFPTQEYHVPTEAELQAVLPLLNASNVQLTDDQITLGKDQQIDLGGIAKGYTSGRVMDIFREHGITSGIVSLGGNVQTLNLKPDGSRWNIGIQDPNGSQGSILAVVAVENKAVVTSGGYERYFEENGKTYIHILDPRTGYPADQDLSSVSIISEDGMLADALSTSLYLLGREGAIAYWENQNKAFDMILITTDGQIYVTEGIKEDIKTGKDVHAIT